MRRLLDACLSFVPLCVSQELECAKYLKAASFWAGFPHMQDVQTSSQYSGNKEVKWSSAQETRKIVANFRLHINRV